MSEKWGILSVDRSRVILGAKALLQFNNGSLTLEFLFMLSAIIIVIFFCMIIITLKKKYNKSCQ